MYFQNLASLLIFKKKGMNNFFTPFVTSLASLVAGQRPRQLRYVEGLYQLISRFADKKLLAKFFSVHNITRLLFKYLVFGRSVVQRRSS